MLRPVWTEPDVWSTGRLAVAFGQYAEAVRARMWDVAARPLSSELADVMQLSSSPT